MDVVDSYIHPDHEEFTPEVLTVQIENKEDNQTCLQETQEPERKLFELKKRIGEVLETDALQEPIGGPSAKKRKENINVERNKEYIEQGESSSEVKEENPSDSAEISTESNQERHRRDFEKLIAEYDFPPDISKRSRINIIKTLRYKYYGQLEHYEKRQAMAINRKKNIDRNRQFLISKHIVTADVPKIHYPKNKMSKSTNKTRVAIDCSYESFMAQKAINTLSSQMGYCFSVNRKMSQPLQLHYTHFKDKILERFDKAMDKYKRWDVFMKQETLAELYSVDEVVYLCAKSENVVETLDDDKVYVIAGFVGDGPHEDIILDQAKAAGYNTARLPVQENFSLNKNYILSIADMFKIFSSFSILGGWKEAIRNSMPKRKWLVTENEDADEKEMGSQRSEMRQQNSINPMTKRPPTRMSESTNKIRIAIDCSFDNLMSDEEVKFMCKLIKVCYYYNIKMSQPFQLYLTQFKDKTFKCFNNDFPLYNDWDIFIKPESLAELYSSSEVVYLCTESDNVLQTLEDDKVYVIAGSLHHSGIRAKVAGLNTARLPIQEYFTMKKGSIFGMNHMFRILSNFSQLGCWKEAINASTLARKLLVEKDVKVEDVKAEDVKVEDKVAVKEEIITSDLT